MPERVILGKKGSNTGLWVSKPGKNAATSTNADDFMVDTSNLSLLRPKMAGVISKPSLPRKSGDSPAFEYKDFGQDDYGTKSTVDGWVHYYRDYQHNLGYTPVAFFSIGSAYAGEQYPTIYIDNTKVRLYHRMENLSWNQNFRPWIYNLFYNQWQRNNTFCLLSDYPASMNYTCDIQYILYDKAVG